MLCYISFITYITWDRHHSRNGASTILSSLRHFIIRRGMRKVPQLNLEQGITARLERGEEEFGKQDRRQVKV